MIRYTFFLPLIAEIAAGQPAKDQSVDDLVREATSKTYYDFSKISAQQREGVVIKLREIAKEKGSYVLLGTAMISPMSADLQLLRLGDTFTIERMMMDYRAYDSMTSWGYVQTEFERSRQPKLIPYLAEDFYSKEDPNGGITVSPPPDSSDFAVGVPPRSIFSGVTVTRIIEKSPAFSPQMKAWAYQAFSLRLESPERFRTLMRVWWDANRAAFERGDYQAVRPVAEQDNRHGNAAGLQTDAKAPPASTPPSAPTTPELPQIPAAEVRQIAPVWPWFVGIVTLVAIVTLVFKRRT